MRIVQCWDDGVVDDIRLIEILGKYGAKASFNLNIDRHRDHRFEAWKFEDRKEVWMLSKNELIDVYAGFLVANHTANHPFLTRISPYEARSEITEGRDKLEQLFGYKVRGFAYPNGDYDQKVGEIVGEAGHLYARTVESATPSYPPTNALAFHPDCHFMDPEFWPKFEKAKAVGDVFYFWGHSYEIVTEIDWQKVDRQIARLDKEGQWADLPELFI